MISFMIHTCLNCCSAKHFLRAGKLLYYRVAMNLVAVPPNENIGLSTYSGLIRFITEIEKRRDILET